MPTVGRTVLARVRDTNGKIKDLPMIVTDVHSDTCVSGVVLSAYSCEGLHAGGTLPLTSLCYSEELNVHSWHWMDVQHQGGGLASRIEFLEDDFAALGESVNNIALTLMMKAPEAKPVE